MFAPGHHLYRSADGSWRYSAPGDVFVRVGGEDRLLALVQRIEAEAPGMQVAEADRAGVGRITTALTERGVLAGPDQDVRVPSSWKAHIEGDGPLVEKLVELLESQSARDDRRIARAEAEVPGAFGGVDCTVGRVDEAAVAESDVIIGCAQWLPDARWRELDTWCTAHRTPWHGCYGEGAAFVLGPLSIPGRTASYRDTRGRRLAAAGLPDELIAHWAYLDSETAKPPVRFAPAAVSVLAGLLAADVLALATGKCIPSEGYQLVVDPATASITRHRVLPLPDLAVNPA